MKKTRIKVSNLREELLIEKLIKISNEGKVSFHTPGHKFGKIFNELEWEELLSNLPMFDTTELKKTDNLHHPTGIIKEAQERASEVFNSEETFFLVNGSTSGIYAMIMATVEPGDKIILGRDCHQSVLNALILGDVEPIYIHPEIDMQSGITLGISVNQVETLLKKHQEVKAILITYPTYYGIASDIKKITEIAHKYDKIMLVDGAHGAHLGLSEKLPITALKCGADVVVESTHKTLPSFTQSSMLHIKGKRVNLEKLKFMLRIHQSSSPSYLLMASLDLATFIYKEKGHSLMKNLLDNIREFKKSMKNLEGISILDKRITETHTVEALDETKIYFGLRNVLGFKLEKILRDDYNIQMEMSNEYGVLGIASIANTKEDFSKLGKAVEEILRTYKEIQKPEDKLQKHTINHNSVADTEATKYIYSPRKAYYMKKKAISLERSIGLICGENIIPYPPGIPLIVAGELIREETIKHLQQMRREKTKVLGIKDTNIEYIEIISSCLKKGQ
ncbi:MAG: aminotransferase class I/II-fold pyridoxal phosphate-dependent enzyme [Alkaliphilus sp.]